MSESHFNIIFSLGQVETVQDGRQPGVEVCRFAAPGRCIKLRRFLNWHEVVDCAERGWGGSAMVVERELMMTSAV